MHHIHDSCTSIPLSSPFQIICWRAAKPGCPRHLCKTLRVNWAGMWVVLAIGQGCKQYGGHRGFLLSLIHLRLLLSDWQWTWCVVWRVLSILDDWGFWWIGESWQVQVLVGYVVDVSCILHHWQWWQSSQSPPLLHLWRICQWVGQIKVRNRQYRKDSCPRSESCGESNQNQLPKHSIEVALEIPHRQRHLHPRMPEQASPSASLGW